MPIAELVIGAVVLAALVGLYFATRLPRQAAYQTASRPKRPPVWLIVLLIMGLVLSGMWLPPSLSRLRANTASIASGRSSDVNGDGLTNIADIERISAARGSTPGQVDWNPALDLDGNNVIDVDDVLLAAGNWRVPNIADFNPKSAPVGSLVTITGSNFISAAGGTPQVTINRQGGGTMPAPVMGYTSGVITITIPTGAAMGRLTVSAAGRTAMTNGLLTITASSDFALAAAPNMAAVMRGNSTSYAVTLSSNSGFTQLAELSVTGLPAGAAATFKPPFLTAGQTSILSITVPISQPILATDLTIGAVSVVEGITLTKSTSVTLDVQPVTTSFVGRAVVADDLQTPLAGVTIKFLGQDGSGGATGCVVQTASDAAGNFVFMNLPPACTGPQLIRYDGSTATSPPGKYAGVDKFMPITADQVNVPMTFIHLPRIDNSETVLVGQNAPADQEFTFQTIPDLKVVVYAGTTFTTREGTQPNPFPLTAIQVPVDRLPGPPPSSTTTIAPFIVAFQPANAEASQPVAVYFPNVTNTPPGTNAPLSTLDPTQGMMVVYGTGTASADGTQIVPDLDPAHPGHRYGLVHFDWHGQVVNPNPTNPGPSCAYAGKPVDLFTGIEVVREIDIAINGPRGGIAIERTYRTLSSFAGPFGIGTNHNYGFMLDTNNLGRSIISLIMPDGNQYPFVKQPDGTLINSTIPALRGAVLRVLSADAAELRWKDGTIFQFVPNSIVYLVSLLRAVTDPNGNTVTLIRNPSRPIQITEIHDPVGRKLTLSYDASDRITTIVDPIGRTVQYTYNTQGMLQTVTDPEGGVTHYSYDAQNRLAQVTDARGVIIAQNTYDGNGRVIEQVQADGSLLRFAYMLLNPLIVTQPLAAGPPAQPIRPTDSGRLLAAADGGGAIGGGFLASPMAVTILTDALGRQTVYRFTPGGFLIDTTDPLGQSRIYDRQPGTNQLLSVRGTGACQTCGVAGAGDQRFTYDANGNLSSWTDALGNITTFTYEPVFNKINSIVDPLDHTTSLTYDARGNLLTQTDENGHTTRFAYDQFGLLTEITDSLGEKTTFTYDSLGNLVAVTDPLGHTTSFRYDAASRLIEVTDSVGRKSRTVYNDLDRVVAIVDPQGNTTQFTYDPVGNLLTVTDARNSTTTFTYDVRNRLKTRTTPLGKTETYTYDLNDNLIAFVDRRGQTSQFTYDALDRLTNATYQDGSRINYFYDAYSRLVRADDSAGGVFDFIYDLVGRTLSAAGPFGTVRYTYDPLGRVTSRQVVGLPPVAYAYDPASNLLTASQPQASVTFAYDARNQLLRMDRSNGVSTTYAYDPLGRVLSLTHAKGATVLNAQTYAYDAVGDLTNYTGDIAQPLITQPITNTYDAGNRLLSSTTQNGTTTNSYDDNGNLVTAAGPGGTTTYSWDARNRLASMTTPAGETTTFRYDFVGNLISRRTTDPNSDFSENFILDNLTNVIYESNSDSEQFSILTGQGIDQHLAVIQPNGQVAFSLTDALNNTVATVDGNGAITSRFFYGPYGQTTVVGNDYPFQYTGRVPVSGSLYYYRARYYDSAVGRFISEDPIGLGGGDVNFYRYVFNAPTNLIDGSGLSAMVTAQAVMNNILGWIQSAYYFWQWWNGIGPTTYPQFGPGSRQVQNMMNAPGVNAARRAILARLRKGCNPRISVSISGKFGLPGLLAAGINPTQQFVGGYRGRVTSNPNGMLTFIIVNRISMNSFLYHMAPSWDRSVYGPGGNVDQTYTWTEPIQ